MRFEGITGRTTFADVCLEELGIVVERVHDDLESLDDTVEELSGGHGGLFRSALLPTRTITLECRAFGDEWEDFDRMRDNLMAAFVTNSEERLGLRNRPGEYYVAHFMGFTEDERVGGSGIGGFQLTFVASDPFRYGMEASATIGNSELATMMVGGSRPTSILIEASARRNTSTQLWGVRFDEADYLRVRLPDNNSHAVSINCETRNVTVDGVTGMVTLDSDWPVIWPGIHEVRMDQGSGSTTITWTERSI